jgi:hypothetical protein
MLNCKTSNIKTLSLVPLVNKFQTPAEKSFRLRKDANTTIKIAQSMAATPSQKNTLRASNGTEISPDSRVPGSVFRLSHQRLNIKGGVMI